MKHLELFAGVGGFRRAMDLLTSDAVMTFHTVGFSEIDKNAITTYSANYNTDNEVLLGDIVSFTKERGKIVDLPDFDILTGGFPCQTFSVMGEQSGFGEERGQLFFRIIDILAIKKPRYVLLENVKNLYTHNGGDTFARIIQELERLDYHVVSNIFNTKDYHLPQRRSRVLIFATLDQLPKNINEMFTSENVSVLFNQHYSKCGVSHYKTVLDILAHQVSSKYFLSERIKPTILADGSANFKSKSDINQIIARTLTASMHKMHRACQDNYYSQDFIDTQGAINPVDYMSKEQLAKLPIRKITPEEAFMLQGFPADFAINGRKAGVKDGSLYKQAGNAVSVNTIYAILYYLISNHIITENVI